MTFLHIWNFLLWRTNNIVFFVNMWLLFLNTWLGNSFLYEFLCVLTSIKFLFFIYSLTSSHFNDKYNTIVDYKCFPSNRKYKFQSQSQNHFKSYRSHDTKSKELQFYTGQPATQSKIYPIIIISSQKSKLLECQKRGVQHFI